MSQNIEIEFKNMLTKMEYEVLLKEFQMNENQLTTQENHYFDTADFALKEKGSALRIRQKKEHIEMTLKQPATIGLLETTQILSAEETSLAIQMGKLPTGMINGLVEKMGIPFIEIMYFGSLLTKRAEVAYENGLLVLDHSYYLNKEDFELEYEVKNYHQGQEIFRQLLEKHGIPLRKTENKIQRFYHQKYSNETKK